MTVQWVAPEASFRSYLQLHSFFNMLILAAILVGLYLFDVPPTQLIPWWLTAIVWLGMTLFFSLFFASRRFLFIGYARTNEAMHLKYGALFRSIRSVPLNRIQHVEYKQAFLERVFGIARLAIYTAGSGGADLTLPGLTPDDAMRFKEELLTTIANEPTEEALTDE